MTTRAWGEEYRTIMVCVDTFQDGTLHGRLYNRYLEEGKAFCSLLEFLQEMERILDRMDFPKAFHTARSFAPRVAAESRIPMLESRVGQKATFAVKVLFRQNASWQGSVTWLEGKQEKSFRSALELVFLLSSALEYQQAS